MGENARPGINNQLQQQPQQQLRQQPQRAAERRAPKPTKPLPSASNQYLKLDNQPQENHNSNKVIEEKLFDTMASLATNTKLDATFPSITLESASAVSGEISKTVAKEKAEAMAEPIKKVNPDDESLSGGEIKAEKQNSKSTAKSNGTSTGDTSVGAVKSTGSTDSPKSTAKSNATSTGAVESMSSTDSPKSTAKSNGASTGAVESTSSTDSPKSTAKSNATSTGAVKCMSSTNSPKKSPVTSSDSEKKSTKKLPHSGDKISDTKSSSEQQARSDVPKEKPNSQKPNSQNCETDKLSKPTDDKLGTPVDII